MRHLVIANWKMNFTLNEVIDYTKYFNKVIYQKNLIIAPPVPFICYLSAIYRNINFAVQNISIYSDFGAYTGEYSSDMIKSCNIDYAIIGHSERRIYFGETEEMISTKLLNLLNSDIIPILCIGETAAMRRDNSFKEFLIQQIKCIISSEIVKIFNNKNSKIIIAYEPIWSIGSDMTLTIDQMNDVVLIIRNTLLTLDLFAQNIYLVYGGSVNAKNYNSIISIDGIDGILVGSSSLKVDEFTKLLNELLL